ncbi:MAG: DMT family transporter, partial [Promethearchaeota archaeon]
MVFAIAAILTVLSGILSGIAHSIQRKSLDSLPELTPRAFYKQHIHLIFAIFTTPLWLLGGVLAVSGALLRWQAFSVADVSILKPLTNVNILVVVFICVYLWGEKMGRAELIGISSLLIGIVILSLTVEERILDGYNVPMYSLCSIICGSLVGLFVLLGSIRRSSERDKELFFALG